MAITRDYFAHDLIRKPVPTFRDHALSHHTRNAARLRPRRLELVLEVAARARSVIAGARIGPGAAAVLGIAGRLAGGARSVGRGLEVAIIATGAVDGCLLYT